MRKMLIIGLLLVIAMPAVAQTFSVKPEIKVILEADLRLPRGHPLAPQSLVSSLVDMLNNRGYPADPLPSGNLSVGDTALRVVYVVSGYQTSGGPLMAASASVALLQRADVGVRNLTLSRYQGVIQSVGYVSGNAAAGEDVSEKFYAQLRRQVDRALRVLR